MSVHTPLTRRPTVDKRLLFEKHYLHQPGRSLTMGPCGERGEPLLQKEKHNIWLHGICHPEDVHRSQGLLTSMGRRKATALSGKGVNFVPCSNMNGCFWLLWRKRNASHDTATGI